VRDLVRQLGDAPADLSFGEIDIADPGITG
jgi:hypothetical protein